MLRSLQDALQRGVVLVPGPLAAQRLQLAVATQQSQPSWQTPAILSWRAWLKQLHGCWLEAGITDTTASPAPRLLNSLQLLAVWEQIVGELVDADALVSISALARACIQSWRIEQQWRVPRWPTSISLNEDQRFYRRAAARFRDWSASHAYVDEYRLPQVLAPWLRTAAGRIPAQVTLWCVDPAPPALVILLDGLREAGCTVQELTSPVPTTGIACQAWPDGQSEYRAAAQWAATRLHADPHTNLAILVPDLGAARRVLERELLEQLAAPQLLQAAISEPLPYTVADGTRLAEHWLGIDTLALLNLDSQHTAVEDWQAVLVSPLLDGGETELHARASFAEQLRQWPATATLAAVLAQAQASDGEGLAALIGVLERLRPLLAQASGARRLPGAWAAHCRECLRAAGWPGERPLDERELRAAEQVHSVLDSLATLDEMTGPVGLSTLRAHWRRLFQDARLADSGQAERLVIATPTLAVGAPFDAVLWLGMDAESMPGPARPEALIPMPLQISAGVPAASAELHYQHMRWLVDTVCRTAGTVRASWVATRDEQPVSASSLLGDAEVDGQQQLQPGWAGLQRHTIDIQTLIDDRGTPFAADTPLRGGSGVLKAQAACPFQAYAGYRLKLAVTEAAEEGLDARDRGITLHRALQAFWSRLPDQAALLAMSEDARAQAVAASVDTALAALDGRIDGLADAVFGEVERQRLIGLLSDWLEVELQRAPFTVVALESRLQSAVSGLTLSLQLDRIDRLADGRLAVIDYKSGTVSVSAWLGERPDEPQLPLYAASIDGDIGALMFAQLQAGKLRYLGLRDDALEEPCKGIKSVAKIADAGDWAALQVHWRQVLEALAKAFLAGQAAVAPKRYPGSCQYCDFGVLCRVHEQVSLDG